MDTDRMEKEFDRWNHVYEGYAPDEEGLREALCTLGNGYFATRGAAEEAEAGGDFHYPGTYVAGGYNRARTQIADREVENEDLVNMPNWLPLRVRPVGGGWITPQADDLLAYEQRLDLHHGVLHRRFVSRDEERRETEMRFRRIVHMANAHLAAIELEIVPLNWSGEVEVWSAIDGGVVNFGVPRYRKLAGKHHDVVETAEVAEDTVGLSVLTRQSRLLVSVAARTRAFTPDGEADGPRQSDPEGEVVAQMITVPVHEAEPTRIEKVVALHTSRDSAVTEPLTASLDAVRRVAGFDDLLRAHRLAWRHLWRRFDTVMAGEVRNERILRLHIFHLLQTASMNTIDLDVGVPARGLHGEAYRGHIFWDELFIFPFLNFRIPELTRALLRYRYRRLPAARRAARAEGLAGALYPWQSGSDGREETQQLHLNPKSGRWLPDNTHLQRHVNAAIAFNVWQYYETTRDIEFLSFYGAEMLLEIARLFCSVSTYDEDSGRYEILGVMGPDEFHDAYPGSDEPGLDNNTYTNVMAVWVIMRALETLDLVGEDRCRELRESLALHDEQLDRWEAITRGMKIVFHDDGILSQFEGYEELEEFDWDGYRERYGEIRRLDRILEAEGDTPNRYKLSKQADVLMLFYLFSDRELQGIFDHLGYSLDAELVRRTTEYYQQRTSHGSTLSEVVHSWVAAREDRAHSWRLFCEALESDVSDVQGGTTREGIHLGAMAGTVDLVQRCYTGLDVRDNILWIDPRLPDDLPRLRLRIRYRGLWIDLDIDRDEFTVAAHQGWASEVTIGTRKGVRTLRAGEQVSEAIPRRLGEAAAERL